MSADYSDLPHHAVFLEPCSITCENVTSDSSANDIQKSESDYACSRSISNQETRGNMNQTFLVFKKGLRVVCHNINRLLNKNDTVKLDQLKLILEGDHPPAHIYIVFMKRF